MLRSALLLLALLLAAPLAGASVDAPAVSATAPVEVRECHGPDSFQVFVNDEPVTHCFVICCEETGASAPSGPEIQRCTGGYRIVWYPYFTTTCLPAPTGGPEVQPCTGGYRITWYPYFTTVCIRV